MKKRNKVIIGLSIVAALVAFDRTATNYVAELGEGYSDYTTLLTCEGLVSGVEFNISNKPYKESQVLKDIDTLYFILNGSTTQEAEELIGNSEIVEVCSN